MRIGFFSKILLNIHNSARINDIYVVNSIVSEFIDRFSATWHGVTFLFLVLSARFIVSYWTLPDPSCRKDIR